MFDIDSTTPDDAGKQLIVTAEGLTFRFTIHPSTVGDSSVQVQRGAYLELDEESYTDDMRTALAWRMQLRKENDRPEGKVGYELSGSIRVLHEGDFLKIYLTNGYDETFVYRPIERIDVLQRA